ncbi:hypothetical protein Lal_00013454 [Lupinus albus]|nr:hypothetical protein Lal_00013454 [Lupinus albus]
MNHKICASLWRGSEVDWIYQPSSIKSGGLLSMWRMDKFQMLSHTSGNGFLEVIGKFWNSNDVCHLVNVYSPCIFEEKRQLWSDLEQRKNASLDKLWYFVGDFNSVRSSAE